MQVTICDNISAKTNISFWPRVQSQFHFSVNTTQELWFFFCCVVQNILLSSIFSKNWNDQMWIFLSSVNVRYFNIFQVLTSINIKNILKTTIKWPHVLKSNEKFKHRPPNWITSSRWNEKRYEVMSIYVPVLNVNRHPRLWCLSPEIWIHPWCLYVLMSPCFKWIPPMLNLYEHPCWNHLINAGNRQLDSTTSCRRIFSTVDKYNHYNLILS